MEAKVILILAAAGGAAYLLTRKSSDKGTTSSPSTPAALARPVITKVALPPLDSGLSEPERSAIQNAISLETRSENLRAFADTFDPVFPLAAGLLQKQAAAMQGARTSGNEPCCDGCKDGSLPCTPHVTGPAIRIGLPKSMGGV